MFWWQETSGLEDTQQGEESRCEDQKSQGHVHGWAHNGQCLKARTESLCCPLLISRHLRPPATAIPGLLLVAWACVGDRQGMEASPGCQGKGSLEGAPSCAGFSGVQRWGWTALPSGSYLHLNLSK